MSQQVVCRRGNMGASSILRTTCEVTHLASCPGWDSLSPGVTVGDQAALRLLRLVGFREAGGVGGSKAGCVS